MKHQVYPQVCSWNKNHPKDIFLLLWKSVQIRETAPLSFNEIAKPNSKQKQTGNLIFLSMRLDCWGFWQMAIHILASRRTFCEVTLIIIKVINQKISVIVFVDQIAVKRVILPSTFSFPSHKLSIQSVQKINPTQTNKYHVCARNLLPDIWQVWVYSVNASSFTIWQNHNTSSPVRWKYSWVNCKPWLLLGAPCNPLLFHRWVCMFCSWLFLSILNPNFQLKCIEPLSSFPALAAKLTPVVA